MRYYKLSEIEKKFPHFFSFHESHIHTFEQNGEAMIFQVTGGFHPYSTYLFFEHITGIAVTFGSLAESINYFSKDGHIGNIEFLCDEHGYKIIFSDYYTECSAVGWNPEMSFAEAEKLPMIQKEVVNALQIECKNLKFQILDAV